MKSAITVSLVSQAKGGPFVFWEGLENAFQTASELGFDAIEIFPESADSFQVEEVQALCERFNLEVAAVGTGAGMVIQKLHLTSADATIRSKAMEFIKEIITVAAKLNSPAIIGSMQGKFEGDVTKGQALEYLKSALNDLGEYAKSQGQVLLYEPLNRYETNLLNRLDETVAFLKELETDHVKILADLYHENIEERNLAEAIVEAGDSIGHVHFADSNRHAIGYGHTEIEPIINALKQINYQGYLSAEIIPLPNSFQAAKQTIESFQKVV
ncbi:Xylose isomerase domain-containing protein TIM barrel [Planctomycetales bacterium 10988]|nr:Xylose isomerase domain-containing protein TIM barrel [Planctomycetales bacterium 10988]